jgi:hypothetical protein
MQMKQPKRNTTFLFIGAILLSLTISRPAWSQGMGKSDNPAYKDYYDSLKQMDYPYLFPLLGKKAYKRGYDVLYPWGISGIYFTQRQDILIEHTLIGLNGGEKVDVSNIIEFGPIVATTNAYTIRPDVWILPFLNLYGVLGGHLRNQCNPAGTHQP